MTHFPYIHNFLLQTKVQQEWLMVSDKVNSLLVILLIIFGGVVFYLFYTGRKINKLEDQLDELEKK